MGKKVVVPSKSDSRTVRALAIAPVASSQPSVGPEHIVDDTDDDTADRRHCFACFDGNGPCSCTAAQLRADQDFAARNSVPSCRSGAVIDSSHAPYQAPPISERQSLISGTLIPDPIVVVSARQTLANHAMRMFMQNADSQPYFSTAADMTAEGMSVLDSDDIPCSLQGSGRGAWHRGAWHHKGLHHNVGGRPRFIFHAKSGSLILYNDWMHRQSWCSDYPPNSLFGFRVNVSMAYTTMKCKNKPNSSTLWRAQRMARAKHTCQAA